MIAPFVQTAHEKLSTFLRTWWLSKTVLCALFCTLVFSSPSFEKLDSLYSTHAILAVLQKQIDHPLKPQQYSPVSHFSKRTFRLFMPLLAKLLNLSAKSLLFIQYILGILFFLVLAKLNFLYTKDKVISFLFVVGFCGIYVGKSFFLDYWAFFDGTAFFFLLLAMYFKNPVLLFLFLSAAFWTDERALVASWGVFVFHLSMRLFIENKEKQSSILTKQTYSWLFSLLLYFLLRYYLSQSFHLTMGNKGIGLFLTLKYYCHYMPLAFFMFLESYWTWILLGIFGLLSSVNRISILICSLLCIGILAQIIVALSVGDMVRSGAYLLVPCITCFILAMSLVSNKQALLYSSFLVFILAFLIPTISNFGSRLTWMKPDLFLYQISKSVD